MRQKVDKGLLRGRTIITVIGALPTQGGGVILAEEPFG